MCVQTITTGENCLYLEYLNNCVSDKAYSPLRLYEDGKFLFIDAKDSKKISISKTGFKVKINGTIFTDQKAAIEELEAQVLCVNQSSSGGGGGGGGDATAANQVLQIDELTKTNNLSLNKEAALIQITNPTEGEISFPLTGVTELTLNGSESGNEIETFNFPAANIPDIAAFVFFWNQIMTFAKIEQVDDSRVKLIPGTKKIPNQLPDSISINSIPSGVLRSYPVSIWVGVTNTPKEETTVLDKVLETIKQTLNVTNRNELEIINFVSGQNATTTPAEFMTNASLVGTHYVLFSIKCNKSGTMYIKEVQTRATTNDQGHICVLKNPLVAGAPLNYSSIAGFPEIQEGKIPSNISPTPQTVTGGIYVASFMADRQNLLTKTNLNRKIEFEDGDEYVFAVNPKSPSLVIEGLCGILFDY